MSAESQDGAKRMAREWLAARGLIVRSLNWGPAPGGDATKHQLLAYVFRAPGAPQVMQQQPEGGQPK